MAEILKHISASRYANLLEGISDIPTQVPTTGAQVLELKNLSASFA